MILFQMFYILIFFDQTEQNVSKYFLLVLNLLKIEFKCWNVNLWLKILLQHLKYERFCKYCLLQMWLSIQEYTLFWFRKIINKLKSSRMS